MPIVFVHGVSTREGAAYRAGIAVKRRFFDLSLDNLVIDKKTLHPVCVGESISFPFWGDLASRYHWDMKSLPGRDVEKLGADDALDLGSLVATVAEIVPAAADDPEPLCHVAKTEGLPMAVFLLNAALIAGTTEEDHEAIAELVVAISQYAEAPSPKWMKSVSTDAALIDLLINGALPDSGGIETLGVAGTSANALRKAGTLLKGGFAHVRDMGGYVVSAGVVKWKRTAMNATVGQFVGDVFRYLVDCRSVAKPPAIGPRIAEAFQGARNIAGPLVIVAHSLGGVITYDLLTHDLPKLEVDLLVTVGSQVAFFEEMKLYRASDGSIPNPKIQKLTRPGNVGQWLNVYDPVDFFAYVCSPVFDGVSDYKYPTRTDSIKAHSAYFEQIGFYRRVRERLEGKA